MADGSVVKRDKDVVRAFETVSLLQEAARLIAYYKFKKNFKSYDLVGAKEALAEYEAAVLGIYGEKSSKQYHDRITAMEKAMKASNFYERENLYTEAVEAYKMRDYNTFIKKLTKYIEMDPNDSAKGYLYRASAYESVKMFDLALADYLQGLELAPEEGNTYFRVGQIYFRQEKEEEAIEYYLKALELALHNIENIMKALSNAYRKLDEVSLAMVYTKRSCRLASQSFEKA